jgi:hypothetical protein
MAGWAPAQLSEAKNISEGFPMAGVLVLRMRGTINGKVLGPNIAIGKSGNESNGSARFATRKFRAIGQYRNFAANRWSD